MSLNDKACGDCANYDPMLSRGQQTGMGRCVAKSTYPAQAQKGQIFPLDAKRAAPGELAKPVIVRLKVVEANCGFFRAPPVASRTKAVR